MATSTSTGMDGHQERPGAVILAPLVDVDLDLWPTVYIDPIAVIVSNYWADQIRTVRSASTLSDVIGQDAL